MRRVSAALGIAMLLALMPACAELETTSNDDGASPTTEPARTTQETPQETESAPETDSPLPTNPAEPTEALTTETADDTSLTGFGATRVAWDEHHEQAPGYTEGLHICR